ncbi:hypothetical protein C1H46_035183 [Malus baccata]|uniref:Ubiquitin-like domain-containing protein n=1 Tax=Malus baccata TaxID=106549 RepID=A0A540KYF6_MALBA|nr:hypothetical protein C1H46_035183 [Malus baccata]
MSSYLAPSFEFAALHPTGAVIQIMYHFSGNRQWMRDVENVKALLEVEVENVKALLEVETQVLLQRQQLLYNGREMRNSEMMSALGVRDEDFIMIVSNAASRIYGCNAFDTCSKEEAATLMELLWHEKGKKVMNLEESGKCTEQVLGQMFLIEL